MKEAEAAAQNLKATIQKASVSTLPNLSQVARGIRPLFILIQCLEANNKAAAVRSNKTGDWFC